MIKEFDVVIIGAGAAGMMAAVSASLSHKSCIILEKNKIAGKELLITGKGRCNITNSADIEEIIKNFPGNGKFLYSTLYTFSNTDLIEFFNTNGLMTKEERGGRIFPVSDRSGDVVETLLKVLTEKKVPILYNTAVKDLVLNNNVIDGVTTDKGDVFRCKSVIVATGGKSYPKTGSTGDGYVLAKKAGHNVIPPEPALVPLYVKESFVKELMGLSLRNIGITFYLPGGKKIFNDFGEMIFTHFGVSGPTVLTGSRVISNFGYKDCVIAIDLKPALDEKKLDMRLLRDFEKYSNKMYKNALDDLLPSKMIPVFVHLSKIDPEMQVNQITAEQRKDIISLLKNFTVTVEKPAPLDEAIVTKGGVDVKEINSTTMESDIVKGLFFAGEVLDIDGFTGGYNLTAAFSTGYTAGYYA